MLKKILSIFLVLVMLPSIAACTEHQNEPTNPTKPTVEDTDTSQEETSPLDNDASGEYDKLNKYEAAAHILDEAYKSTNQNTMFSPLSLNMALGLVAEGADETYDDLFEALLDEKDYPVYAEKYSEYLARLNIDNSESEFTKYKTVFEIANSLWVDDAHAFQNNYLDRTKPFAAEITSVDFSNAHDVVTRVNNWCAEKTRDMIKEILTEDAINPESLMVAVNAVYFESPWLEAWEVSEESLDFVQFGGSQKAFYPITTVVETYYENDYAKAFGCQYLNGLSFIGILPNNSGEFSIESLDIKSLLESKTSKYDVNVKMPTLKFDNKIQNLKEILTDMGYGKLFDGRDGIFTNILTNGNQDAQLTISDIIQADSIELDESGTKAAAVTAIIMDNCTSIPMEKDIIELTFDRPYAFIIYDHEMEQIVFIGKVVDPIS